MIATQSSVASVRMVSAFAGQLNQYVDMVEVGRNIQRTEARPVTYPGALISATVQGWNRFVPLAVANSRPNSWSGTLD